MVEGSTKEMGRLYVKLPAVSAGKGAKSRVTFTTTKSPPLHANLARKGSLMSAVRAPNWMARSTIGRAAATVGAGATSVNFVGKLCTGSVQSGSGIMLMPVSVLRADTLATLLLEQAAVTGLISCRRYGLQASALGPSPARWKPICALEPSSTGAALTMFQ